MRLLQTQKSYVVHYKFWRHILDGDANGFHGAYKLINIHHLLIFLKIFLHVLISEASKYNMCKFYQIASNSLQVIHIVHKLFDCPSYIPVLNGFPILLMYVGIIRPKIIPSPKMDIFLEEVNFTDYKIS